MPRNLAKVPSYRLHKSSGQGVVTLCGKDIYLGKHGSKSSERRYREVIAEWLASHQQTPASSNTGTLPEAELINGHL